MTDFDPGILRPWLDEHEGYAASIKRTDPRFEIAKEMLGIIAVARESLRPSADSTANYIQNKEIIQQLAILRDKAEHTVKGKQK